MTVLVERLARAWASVDGRAEMFDACKADHALDLKEGRYMGYMADAEELLDRSGILDRITALEAQVAAADRLVTLVEAEKTYPGHVGTNEIDADDWAEIMSAAAAFRAAKGE